MRILQILEATIGGTARHGLDLCGGLRRAGHEVHFIYNPKDDRMDEIFRRGLASLQAAGVILVPIVMRRSVGLSDAGVIWKIRSYIRGSGPFDVIHGHSSKGGAYARLAAVGLPGVRLYTPNAFITTNPQLGSAAALAYGLIERMLGRLGHALIAVSREELEEARRLGVGDERLFLVPNGSDVRAATPGVTRSSLGLPEEALVIGSVGRFVPQKAPANLIRAFARVAQSIPHVHLAMVGDGPLLNECRAEAATLGIDAARLHWPGILDGPSVMPLFDIFALPSLFEGFPYVLIEAMSCGLPIVTTAIGGAPELIEHGGNGFIVPVGRPEMFAECLARLLQDSRLRREMGERSRQRAGMFTAERMVAGNLDVYERVTRRSRDRA